MEQKLFNFKIKTERREKLNTVASLAEKHGFNCEETDVGVYQLTRKGDDESFIQDADRNV